MKIFILSVGSLDRTNLMPGTQALPRDPTEKEPFLCVFCPPEDGDKTNFRRLLLCVKITRKTKEVQENNLELYHTIV